MSGTCENPEWDINEDGSVLISQYYKYEMVSDIIVLSESDALTMACEILERNAKERC